MPRFLPSSLLAAMLSLLVVAPLAAKKLPPFADLAEQAGPAVVNISTETSVQTSGGMDDFFRNQPPDSPFREFFRGFEDFFGIPQDPKQHGTPDRRERPRTQRSAGSGFIISEDGYIVTNNHVAGEADVVRVHLQGHSRQSESYEATVVGRDEETDLALLKIETDQKLPVLHFGDSDALEVGDWVMAIGNPFGLDHTVTAGIISAKGRVIGSGPFDDFLQTDASINPGNSGGPLINLDGEVVGINTAIVASGQGIGFAIPSNLARRVITQLKNDKKVSRGWLGVSIQDVDDNAAKALGLDSATGALVSQVFEGHPADEAGLRAGDVILGINGQDVEDSSDLLRKIAAIKPGESITLKIWRRNKTRTLTATLGERDLDRLAAEQNDSPAEEQAAPEPSKAELGLELKPVTEEEAQQLGLDAAEGLLVVNVEPGSPAMESGIVPQDVILEANMQPVNAVQDFDTAIEQARDDKGVVMLLLKRRGRNLFRTVPLD